MSTFLTLDQTYVQCGLGTLTFTVPATILNGPAVSNVVFNVKCQVTFPEALATGFGAGTAADQGLGVTGGFSGAGAGAQNGLGQGASGLGFGGSTSDGATGTGSGYGAGAGGGGEGFTQGDQGLGHGGVGQGFGTGNGYPQPPAFTNTPTSGPAVSSGLSILVKQNGTTVYTAPTIQLEQSSLRFQVPLLCTAADSITIVFGSSTASDKTLNGLVANVSVGTGA